MKFTPPKLLVIGLVPGWLAVALVGVVAYLDARLYVDSAGFVDKK